MPAMPPAYDPVSAAAAMFHAQQARFAQAQAAAAPPAMDFAAAMAAAQPPAPAYAPAPNPHVQAMAAVHQAAAFANMPELSQASYAQAMETLRRHHSAAMALVTPERSPPAGNENVLMSNREIPSILLQI